MAMLSYQEMEELMYETRALLRTKLPLGEGMERLAKETSSLNLSVVAKHLAKELERGRTLGEAVASSPIALSPAMAVLLESAERGGTLPDMIDFAIEHGRRLKQHDDNLTTALSYPFGIIVLMLVIFTVLANFVLPHFHTVFDQLGAELPWLTERVMDVGRVFEGAGGIFVLVVVVALIVAITVPSVRRRWLPWLQYTPGIDSLSSAGDSAIAMHVAAIMLRRGATITYAMNLAAGVANHAGVALALRQVADAAEKGGDAAEAVEALPGAAGYLYRQGEKSGDMATACEEIAEYCQHRYTRLSRNSVAIMEPVVICVIGLVLGVAIFSLYIPLFSIPKLVGR